MNGARSTFMRQGYWLTGLAALVLLTASSGTAYAQTPSVDFTSSTVTVKEGAGPADSDNPAVTVMVRVSGLPGGKIGMDDGAPTARQAAINQLGSLTYRLGDDEGGLILATGGLIEVDPATQSPGDLSDELEDTDTIELTLTASEDADWKDDSFTLRVVSDKNINTGSTLQGTIDDDEFVPVAEFSRTSIKIAENSSTTVSVSIKTSGAVGETPTELTGATGPVVLSVSPADAIFAPSAGVTGCPNDPKTAQAAVFVSSPAGMTMYDAMKGELTINNVSAIGGAPQTLTLEACDDMAGFRSPMITLSFKADSLETVAGDVTAGNQLVVNVESDEEIPVVSFFPTDVFINEGGMHDSIISAVGDNNTEVMTVKLSVHEHSDALVDLYLGADKLEAGADGLIEVKLSNGQARVMAKATEDPDLYAGASKKKT